MRQAGSEYHDGDGGGSSGACNFKAARNRR